MNYFEIIKRFNKQIATEKKQFNLQYDNETKSYWEKQFFMATVDLTLEDWKRLRKEGYFELKTKKQRIEFLNNGKNAI